MLSVVGLIATLCAPAEASDNLSNYTGIGHFCVSADGSVVATYRRIDDAAAVNGVRHELFAWETASGSRLIDATHARGTWALEDTVIHTQHDFTLRGAAFYRDEYVKSDGEWRIQHTGYERIYEEMQPRKEVPGLVLTQNMWERKPN